MARSTKYSSVPEWLASLQYSSVPEWLASLQYSSVPEWARFSARFTSLALRSHAFSGEEKAWLRKASQWHDTVACHNGLLYFNKVDAGIMRHLRHLCFPLKT